MIGYNPFSNTAGYGAMKTPQQYQQELNQLQQQYTNQYNQVMNNIPQYSNTQVNNGGIFHYVKSYDEVVQAQIPMNGRAELFISDDGLMMWSKKLINGQPYIKPFSINQINNVGEPTSNEKENNDKLQAKPTNEPTNGNFVEKLSKLIEQQQEMNCRLSGIEDKVYGKHEKTEQVKAEVIDNPFKKGA